MEAYLHAPRDETSFQQDFIQKQSMVVKMSFQPSMCIHHLVILKLIKAKAFSKI